jgi:hypothetical protein
MQPTKNKIKKCEAVEHCDSLIHLSALVRFCDIRNDYVLCVEHYLDTVRSKVPILTGLSTFGIPAFRESHFSSAESQTLRSYA